MLARIILFSMTSIILFSCNNATSEAVSQTDEGASFGQAITSEGAISYEELLGKIPSDDSLAVKVVGKVESVCQKKGCWMNIVSEDAEKASMFVKFKDYGFFMPKDISGKKVIMDGYAFKEVTSVEELKHYAEDEGKSKEEIEAIKEPVEELKFLASGVLLLKE